jgi:class 3 adenylate cyclase/ribosomal protein L20A (L18A)
MFDKTVGDQIVAIFGTPKDQYPANPYHAFDAVDCARKLVKVTEEINREMQAAIQDNYTFIAARYKSLSREDREDIKIEDLKFQCRVGINTSNPTSEREIDRMRMVMMGAETYVDYTAQGGAVIYAFRLESNATPGEIHIGENTKNKIEHVYQIRELAPITLKGLGLQQRYTITGHVSLFDSIFPKTAFFQKYYNNIPEYIFRLYHDICFGQIRIKEVQKIKEFVEVDLPYLEHMAGYYNLLKARALFVHATAGELEYPENRIKTLVFSSFWYNASHLKVELETLEINSCKEYEDEDIDMAEVEDILTDLDTSRPALPTSKIIAMCNQFDRMVFDRTYLGSHSQEIMSAKEVISLMKIENRFEPALLNVLEKLMIAEGEELAQEPTEYLNDIVFLPSNPELLAEAVKKNYPREKREKLMMHLG